MELFSTIQSLVIQIDNTYNTKSVEALNTKGRESILQVFLREILRAILLEKSPWINYLPPHIKDFLEQVLVNILEGEFLEAAGLSTDNKKHRLSILDQNKFHLNSKDFAIFLSKWQYDFRPSKDIDGMARFVIKYLDLEKE